MKREDWLQYIYIFIITAVIFVLAFSITKSFNKKRFANIESIQRDIAIDLLASEIQFNLLKQTSCDNIKSSALSQELGKLGEKLAYMESKKDVKEDEVKSLKKYYSLLEIKDFLLMSELSEKCGIETISALYFYSDECNDCQKQGYVLTRLKKKYPEFRIYSFDYDLDLSVIQTLASVYGVSDSFPVLIIDEDVYNGFVSVEEVEELVPELSSLEEEHERMKLIIDFIKSQEEYKNLLKKNELEVLNKTEEDNNFIYELQIGKEEEDKLNIFVDEYNNIDFYEIE